MTDPREQAVEAAARVLDERNPGEPGAWLDDTRAAISAYEKALGLGSTHVIVPRQATEEMLRVGGYQLEPDTNEREVARDVWEAMIEAASPVEKG